MHILGKQQSDVFPLNKMTKNYVTTQLPFQLSHDYQNKAFQTKTANLNK